MSHCLAKPLVGTERVGSNLDNNNNVHILSIYQRNYEVLAMFYIRGIVNVWLPSLYVIQFNWESFTMWSRQSCRRDTIGCDSKRFNILFFQLGQSINIYEGLHLDMKKF